MRILHKWRRFPAAVIQYAVWLYFRFILSLRDIVDIIAQCDVHVNCETIRA